MIIFKIDQGPAILALKDSAKAATGLEVILEESPVGESQSNGRVERAVRTVKGQVRTIEGSNRLHISGHNSWPSPSVVVAAEARGSLGGEIQCRQGRNDIA